MSRNSFENLTGPMFYLLLALQHPRCGVEIMERVREITKGRVRLGPGTLYTLLARFQDAGMIQETCTEGRRRTYQLTPKGEEALREEHQRLCCMIRDYELFWEKEEKP